MSYQSLLFCPDEKTARTVTQVLTELEFSVEPCSEPFAAVKKLMGEHFDAIVVDCDNEQNATLLFKSARNSTSNQASLAVAVVEGQAGVAKAFRIGANLVLTKPLNVEQAKGTLRVARGLLRKGEPAKPVAPTGTIPVPAKADHAAPVPKRAVQPASAGAPAPRPSGPYDPSALWQVSNPAPSSTSPVASSTSAAHDQDLLDIDGGTSAATPALNAAPRAATAFKPLVNSVSVPPISKATGALASPGSFAAEVKASQGRDFVKAPAPQPMAGSTTGQAAFGTGAASAPAPARSASEAEVVEPSASKTASEAVAPFGKTSESGKDEYRSVTSRDAPSFTLGEDNAESSFGGSKKALVGMAAAVVVATGLYFGWTQFHKPATSTSPVSTDSIPTTPASTVTTPGSNTQSVAPSTISPPSPSASTSSPGSKTTLQSKAAAKSPATTDNNDAPDKNAEPETKGLQRGSNSLAAAKSAPELKPAPAPIVVKKIQPSASFQASEPADAPAPSVLVAATSAGGSLPNLIGDPGITAQPVLQTLNISQGVSQGLLIKKVQPSYPPYALRMNVEGPVQLLATIGKSGNITAVKTLSGEPLLAKAALDAVKQWKYKPYYLNGEPVEIQTQITVNFKLPH